MRLSAAGWRAAEPRIAPRRAFWSHNALRKLQAMQQPAAGSNDLAWHVAQLLPGQVPIKVLQTARLNAEQQALAAGPQGYIAITDGMTIHITRAGLPGSAVVHLPLLPPSQAQQEQQPAAQQTQGSQAAVSCLAWSAANTGQHDAAIHMLAAACGPELHVFAVSEHDSGVSLQPVWVGSVAVDRPSAQVTAISWHPTIPAVLAFITQDGLHVVRVLPIEADVAGYPADANKHEKQPAGSCTIANNCKQIGTAAAADSCAMFGRIQGLASVAAPGTQVTNPDMPSAAHKAQFAFRSSSAGSCLTWLDTSHKSSTKSASVPGTSQQARHANSQPQPTAAKGSQAGQQEQLPAWPAGVPHDAFSLLVVCWGCAASAELQLLLWHHPAGASTSTHLFGNSTSSTTGSSHTEELHKFLHGSSCKWECIKQQRLSIMEMLGGHDAAARHDISSSQGTQNSSAASDVRVRALLPLAGAQLLLSVESATLPLHAPVDISPSADTQLHGSRVGGNNSSDSPQGCVASEVSAPLDLRGRLGSRAAQAGQQSSLLQPNDDLSMESGLLLPDGRVFGLQAAAAQGSHMPSLLQVLTGSHTAPTVPSLLLLSSQGTAGPQATGSLLLVGVSVKLAQSSVVVDQAVAAALAAAGVIVPGARVNTGASVQAREEAALTVQVRCCTPLSVPHPNILTTTTPIDGLCGAGKPEPCSTNKALVAVGSTTTPAILHVFELSDPPELTTATRLQSHGLLWLAGKDSSSTELGMHAAAVCKTRIRGAHFEWLQNAQGMQLVLQVLQGSTTPAGAPAPAPITFLQKKGLVTSQLHGLHLAQYIVPPSMCSNICTVTDTHHLTTHGPTATTSMIHSWAVDRKQDASTVSTTPAAGSSQQEFTNASHGSNTHGTMSCDGRENAVGGFHTVQAVSHIGTGLEQPSPGALPGQAAGSYDMLLTALKQHIDMRMDLLQEDIHARLAGIEHQLSQLGAAMSHP